jgi:hypothetical protein
MHGSPGQRAVPAGGGEWPGESGQCSRPSCPCHLFISKILLESGYFIKKLKKN